MIHLAMIGLSATLSAGEPKAPEASQYLVMGAAKFAADETVGFCGAEARAGIIQSYFNDIRREVATGNIKRFAKYYAGRVTIGFQRETYVRGGPQLASSKALRLSLHDWSMIGELSKTQLGSGGWRGCFVSDGKASFAIQNDGRLMLVAFDKDRPWRLH